MEIASKLGRSYDSVELKIRRIPKSQDVEKKEFPPVAIPENPQEPLAKKIFNLFSIHDPIIKTDWIFDSHFPHNLSINPILRYLNKRSPDVFGFGGDNWSLDCISHWNQAGFKNEGMDNVMKAFVSESEAFKRHIRFFIEAMPKTKFVYILGNHEDWLQQFCSEFPQTKKPTIQSILEEFKDRIEFVPRGGFYNIGKLYFAHGDQFGSSNPAKQAVERTNKTIVFGHHHVYKVWPQFSMVDQDDKHLGIGVPCFCGVAPEYGKGRPNQWLNGFFSACIKRKSGKFTPYVIPVSSKGGFMTMDGTEY